MPPVRSNFVKMKKFCETFLSYDFTIRDGTLCICIKKTSIAMLVLFMLQNEASANNFL